ncbi:MAG: hypothetical protein HND57_10860 [Planctomycetes bacterium]|nr:hypothetical protein [Planctomycetota bacterium]
MPQRPLLAVSVGNSRVAVARIEAGKVCTVQRVAHQATKPGDDVTNAVCGELDVLIENCASEQQPVVLLASVREPVARPLYDALSDKDGCQVLWAERERRSRSDAASTRKPWSAWIGCSMLRLHSTP